MWISKDLEALGFADEKASFNPVLFLVGCVVRI